MGVSAAPAADVAALQGQKLKIVGSWQKTTLQYLVAGGGVTSVEQLKGKRLGLNGSTAGSSHILAGYALRSAGLSADDVEVLSLQDYGTQVQAFIGGQIDATMIAAPALQKAQAARPDTKIIREFTELAFPDAEIITNTAWAEENPELVVKVLTALDKALAKWRDDPSAAKATIATALKIDPTETDLLDELYTDATAVFLDQIEPMTEEDERSIFELAAQNGVKEADPAKASLVIDTSYAEKIAR